MTTSSGPSKDKDISTKIHTTMSSIHQAFMQPKNANLPSGQSLRKAYWIKAWSEIKLLAPEELEELVVAIDSMQQTLSKLKEKVQILRHNRIKAQQIQRSSLENLNEWEDDEFLDSKAVLPVFSEKKRKQLGKRWVITQSLERPKTAAQTCQAVWIVLTNRAITIVDGNQINVQPSLERDTKMEKQRLSALPNFLDDQTVTDPLSGKPIMNLYFITQEVKETMLWLLCDRAKKDALFRKLYVQFLSQEIVKKAKTHPYANKFASLAMKILHSLGVS